MDYNSAINLSNELLTVLSADDVQLKLSDEFPSIHSEIKELIAKRLAAIKKEIQELRDQQEEENISSKDDGHRSISDIENEIETLRDIRNKAKKHLTNTEEECRELTNVFNKSVAEQKKLREKIERIKNEAGISLPKARYDVNLYSNISNIRCRYDCGPDEVSGYVCKKNDVKPFSVDTKQVSHFFLVNYLWDLLAEGK